MFSEDIETFMAAAISCAKEGLSQGEIPIGCVITFSDEIVASAFCQDRLKGLLFHAELTALSRLDRKRFSIADRKRMTIYRTLEPLN